MFFCLFGKGLVTEVHSGFKIKMTEALSKRLKKEDLHLSVVKSGGKPTSVQMMRRVDGKLVYAGTLKQLLEVKKFKNGNVCDFTPSNLIFKK